MGHLKKFRRPLFLVQAFGFLHLLILCGIAALGPIACDDTEISTLTPVWITSTEQIDFGEVQIAQDKFETFQAKNTGPVSVTVVSANVQGACTNCFIVTALPDVLRAGTDEPVTVRFRPNKVGPFEAELVLIDSDNTEKHVTLLGKGVDGRLPDIAVVPEEVDFGAVPVGGVALASFRVKSTGLALLKIDSVAIETKAGTSPFQITSSVPSLNKPAELKPGSESSVALRVVVPASLTSSAAIDGSLLITSNVLSEKNVKGVPGAIRVPLHARTNRAPIAVIEGDEIIDPWTEANLSGEKSSDPDGDVPLSYQWRFVSVPPGSRAKLERAFSSKSKFFADVAGRYEVELVVTDSVGLESVGARHVVNARPDEVLHIELTWDHPYSDVDLHLVREGGQFCDCNSDAYYKRCGKKPNWFPEMPGANPSLDVDQQFGFGPENINIDGDGQDKELVSGRYTVMVQYFNTGRSSPGNDWPSDYSTATVRIYLYGLLAAEFTQKLGHQVFDASTGKNVVEAGDVWVAATIDWPSQKIVGSTDVLLGLECR